MRLFLKTPAQQTTPCVQDNKTVLIIDKNADFVRTVREMLVQKGYRVLSASALAETCYAGTKPDLILCDMSLALNQAGVSLKHIRIRLAHKRVPVLLMSLHGTLHDIRYALKIGADDCIAKSMSSEMLVMAIETRLQQISTI